MTNIVCWPCSKRIIRRSAFWAFAYVGVENKGLDPLISEITARKSSFSTLELDSNEKLVGARPVFEMEAHEIPMPELGSTTDRNLHIFGQATSGQWQREELEG